MINKTQKFTKDILLLTLTNIDEQIEEKGYKNEQIEKYNEVIKEVASERNLTFVDILGVLTKEDLSIDGLHPNANGHKKIFQKVLRTVENS